MLCDRRGQGRFAMIDMADGSHVQMRLRPFKFRFGHFRALLRDSKSTLEL
jgi:hypothetical protein